MRCRWFTCLLLIALCGCQAAAPGPGAATRPAAGVTASVGQAPAQQAGTPAAGMVLLAISADPDGAQVSVDGQVKGSSPITLSLPAGVHQMTLAAPGFAALSEPVTLTVGQEGIYTPVLEDVEPPAVTLVAEPRQVPWLGQSQLRASAKDNRAVSELQLLLNGQVLGDVDGGELTLDFTPSAAGGLAPGQIYTLTARALDEAGNAGQTELPLAMGPLPQETRAVALAGTATQPAKSGGTATQPARPTLPVTQAPARATLPAATATAASVAPSNPTAAPQPAERTTYRVTSVIIPTYPYTPYLHTVIDAQLSDYPVLTFDRTAYEAARRQPAPVAYTLIVLENRYLKLTLLPDLGGRIYEVIFKPTGNDELYRNPVIKPSPWGPGSPDHPAGANWWLAVGGIEWAFPVEEHGYEWAKSWGYDFYEDDDGSATVTVFTRDYQRPYVAVAITLPPDSAAFTVQPRIVNPLGAAFRFKWWDNAMLAPGAANKPGPDLRFIVPGSEVTVHSTSDSTLPPAGQAMSWPSYGGRDLSRLGNWQGWLGFFARPAAQAGFAAVYDSAANEGLVRVFPAQTARGVKGFGLGWGQPIDPTNYTDDGSGYVELHGGLAPAFDDWSELPPGEELMWDETWYPAAGMGGLVYAAAGGAVNVSRTAGGARVAVFPARPVAGRLQVTLPGAAPVSLQVDLSPDRPFNQEFSGTVGQGEATVTLTDAQGRAVIDYRGVMR